jgi:hypothetical protein
MCPAHYDHMRASFSSGSSSQYVQVIARMIFDEPCVYGMITNQQSMSLKHGIIVRWGYTPPTPSFQDHINRHYLPFCKDAILLFLAVGFVPFRIRKSGHVRVPEALPLGTFTWTVCGSETKHRKRPRQQPQAESSDDTAKAVEHDDEPLLVYDVTCPYCKEDIHVFNFVQPHTMLDCFSPLAVLIPQYNALCAVRELALRTMESNAHSNNAIEEQDKTMLNSVADSGAAIGRLPTQLAQGVQSAEQQNRLKTVQSAVDTARRCNQLPPNARAFVLPKNNTVKPLDKPVPPPDLFERELAFTRSVATVLGLPATGGLQGTAPGGHRGHGWTESPEMFSRAVLDSCQKINQALQQLLRMAYVRIYHEKPSDKIPIFHIPVAPNLPYELLLPLFDAQILDDLAYSRIFEASTGFPLGERALKAREERHKAVTTLAPSSGEAGSSSSNTKPK